MATNSCDSGSGSGAEGVGAVTDLRSRLNGSKTSSVYTRASELKVDQSYLILGLDKATTQYGETMENSAFDADAEKGVLELNDVKIAISDTQNMKQPHSCQPDVCRSMHAKYLQEKSKISANPWDRLKTGFLVGIIALLTLWLLVYSASAWMGLV